MFPIIVILLLIIYLTIKYVLKKDREEKEKVDNEDDEEYNIDICERDAYNDKIKNKMLKTDIDRLLLEKNRRKEDIIMNDKNKNVSDHISADYLLTEDDNESETKDNNDIIKYPYTDVQLNIPMTGIMMPDEFENQSVNYDINNAATLIFGNNNLAGELRQ